jgi:hypothetical protein
MAGPPGFTDPAVADELAAGLPEALGWPAGVLAGPLDCGGTGAPVETAAPDFALDPALDAAWTRELAEFPDDVQPTMSVAIPIPAMDTARELAAMSLMICKTLPSPLWLNAIRDGIHANQGVTCENRHLPRAAALFRKVPVDQRGGSGI